MILSPTSTSNEEKQKAGPLTTSTVISQTICWACRKTFAMKISHRWPPLVATTANRVLQKWGHGYRPHGSSPHFSPSPKSNCKFLRAPLTQGEMEKRRPSLSPSRFTNSYIGFAIPGGEQLLPWILELDSGGTVNLLAINLNEKTLLL